MKEAFEGVYNLSDKTLEASREESSFHDDISEILKVWSSSLGTYEFLLVMKLTTIANPL